MSLERRLTTREATRSSVLRIQEQDQQLLRSSRHCLALIAPLARLIVSSLEHSQVVVTTHSVELADALADHTGDGRLPVVGELVSRAAYHRDGIDDRGRARLDDLLADLEHEPV